MSAALVNDGRRISPRVRDFAALPGAGVGSRDFSRGTPSAISTSELTELRPRSPSPSPPSRSICA